MSWIGQWLTSYTRARSMCPEAHIGAIDTHLIASSKACTGQTLKSEWGIGPPWRSESKPKKTPFHPTISSNSDRQKYRKNSTLMAPRQPGRLALQKNKQCYQGLRMHVRYTCSCVHVFEHVYWTCMLICSPCTSMCAQVNMHATCQSLDFASINFRWWTHLQQHNSTYCQHLCNHTLDRECNTTE